VLNLTEIKCVCDVAQIQSILINVALLVFLFRNVADFKPAKHAVKPATDVNAGKPASPPKVNAPANVAAAAV
jgi:hypothetical protein